MSGWVRQLPEAEEDDEESEEVGNLASGNWEEGFQDGAVAGRAGVLDHRLKLVGNLLSRY